MKSILLSVRPEWVAKILNGEKTIEIRKTAPKCELPIDVYIYCTKDKNNTAVNMQMFFDGRDFVRNGKVVAKFRCYKVEKLERYTGVYIPETILHTDSIHTRYSMEKKSCLSMDEIWEYTNGNGYAWHISELVILDKPKELSEFYDAKRVEYYRKLVLKNIEEGVFKGKLSDYSYLIFQPSASLCKAPQSWCYVEVEE